MTLSPIRRFAALFVALFGLLAVPICPAGFAAASEAGAAAADLLLILDASGSMWGQIDGENKIVIARRVLGELVGELPEASEVGLIAYGHRRDGDCADIETVVPLGPLDRPALTRVVDGLNPKGKTPITASIDAAVAEISRHGRATTLILVSDGLETCGGDPCAAVAAARQQGADFLLHVVGFGIEEGDVSQLECAAQAGGGLYFAAADAGQLQDALGRAMEASAAPDEPPATLAVEVVKNGERVDAMVEVVPAGGGDAVAAGRTYSGPETNPRKLPVPPGTYDLTIRALRLRGEPVIRIPGVEVPGGEIVARRVDFSSGELGVKVTRNGALSDAMVTVAAAASGDEVAGGRTYNGESSNPKVFELTPGEYVVEARTLEVEGAEARRWQGVTVEAGERVDLSHEVASGELAVGMVDGDEWVDAMVVVRRDGQNVAGGRTYTNASSNPKVFVVEPGTYSVEVRAIRHADRETRHFEMTVEAEGRSDEVVRVGG